MNIIIGIFKQSSSSCLRQNLIRKNEQPELIKQFSEEKRFEENWKDLQAEMKNSKKDLVKNNMLQCDCSINYSEFPINVVIFQALLSALISKDYWMNAVIAIS